jgi:hypothetical protein
MHENKEGMDAHDKGLALAETFSMFLGKHQIH